MKSYKRGNECFGVYIGKQKREDKENCILRRKENCKERKLIYKEKLGQTDTENCAKTRK